MKKLVLMLLFLFMIVGCKQSGEVKNSMSGANFSAEEKEDFMGIVALAKALSDGKYTVTSKISDIELEVVFDYLSADDSYDYPIQKGDKRELVITKENNFYMLREYLNNKLMVTEKHSTWEEVFFYEENGSNLGDGSGENTFTSEEKEYIEKTHYAKKEINDNKIILQTNFR